MQNNQSKTETADRLLAAASNLNLDLYPFAHYTNQVSAGCMARMAREITNDAVLHSPAKVDELYVESIKLINFLQEVGQLVEDLQTAQR